MQSFRGASIVIKYGGSAMVEPQLRTSFAHDIVLLKHIGINPVVVHGGGPQIAKTLEQMNIKTSFINGFRVTDAKTLDVVEMALVGKVNKEIVTQLNLAGGRAVGLSGKDGNLIHAEKMFIEQLLPEFKRPEIIDIGMVGKVKKVDINIIELLENGGYIPVIAPVGCGSDGSAYNINADFVASAVASALKAEKLILLTDTEGVLDPDGNLIQKLSESGAKEMIASNDIKDGMLPKVRACLDGLSDGIKQTHIIDGRVKCATLLEIFTDTGVGTEIIIN
ncbi:MAG: acetylglutamate kinase [Nitrospinota bacterium]